MAHGERALRAHLEADDVGVEARRVGLGAHLDLDSRVPLRRRRRGRGVRGRHAAPLEVDGDGVADGHAAVLDRLGARRLPPQLVEGVRHLGVGDLERRAPHGQAAAVARVHRRQRLEGGREGQRPALLDVDVADGRGLQRLHPALAEGLVDGLLDEAFGDLLQDLLVHPLPDQARRRLAGPEAGDAGRASIALGQTLDLAIDVGRRHFDRDARAGVAEVRELRLHVVDRGPWTLPGRRGPVDAKGGT